MCPQSHSIGADIDVFVRGWLHGNALLLRGERPALIDTGYCTGAHALIKRFESFVGPIATLEAVALTHVHSDHCGAVAALRSHAEFAVTAHPDAAQRVAEWTDAGMWLGESGQELPRFTVDETCKPGDVIDLGDRHFRVLWTPGHACGGVALFDEENGLLISGDALWENGFGLLNIWLEGPGAFDLAEQAIDTIAATGATTVVPGHLNPFDDLLGAVARARSRLAYLRANPASLRKSVLKSSVAFYALAHPKVGPAALLRQTQRMAELYQPLDGDPQTESDEALAASVIAGLVAAP